MIRLGLPALLLTGCHLVFTLEDRELTPADFNIAFITAQLHDGDLGGLDGADQLCNAAAKAEDLPGTYVAWLSTDSEDAIERLGTARGWLRLDGQPVADRPTDLTSRGPLVPIAFTESGEDTRAQPPQADNVLTGTRGNGTDFEMLDCDGWTSVAAQPARRGDQRQGGTIWTDLFSFDSLTCGAPGRLYCFGIDKTQELEVPEPTAPVAFLSSTAWSPTDGIRVADELCASDAKAAGFEGEFLAALATTTTSILDRFTAQHDYVRADGVFLGKIAGTLNTYINVTAAGALENNELVWTGGAPGETRLLTDTCNDWALGATTGIVGASSTSDPRAFIVSGSIACDAHRVYCLQN